MPISIWSTKEAGDTHEGESLKKSLSGLVHSSIRTLHGSLSQCHGLPDEQNINGRQVKYSVVGLLLIKNKLAPYCREFCEDCSHYVTTTLMTMHPSGLNAHQLLVH